MIRARLRAPLIHLFQAPLPMEMVSTLNVYDYGLASVPYRQFPERVRLAHVLLPACKVGDKIQIGANFQATNDLSYAVEFTSRLVLTRHATGIDGLVLSGGAGTGYNISPEMHHGDQHITAAGRIPEDGDWYVALMVYAGGASMTQPGDILKIDVGYGDLDVMRYRVT